MNLEKVLKYALGLGAGIYFSLANVNCQFQDGLIGAKDKWPNSRAVKGGYNKKIRIITGIKGDKLETFSLVDETPIYTSDKGASKSYVVGSDSFRYNKDHYFRILKDTIELAKFYNRVIDMDIRDFNGDGNFDFVVLTEMLPFAPKDSSSKAYYASRANTHSKLSLLISNEKGEYEKSDLYEFPKNSIVKIALLPKGGLAMLDERTPVKSSVIFPGVYYSLYDELVLSRDEKGKISLNLRKEGIESYSREFPILEEELFSEKIKDKMILSAPKKDFEFFSKKD